MGGICYGRRLSLGDSHSSALAKSRRWILTMHDLKTWQMLATNSCEMPLNKQLWPVTDYKKYPWKITICMALAGPRTRYELCWTGIDAHTERWLQWPWPLKSLDMLWVVLTTLCCVPYGDWDLYNWTYTTSNGRQCKAMSWLTWTWGWDGRVKNALEWHVHCEAH